MRSVLHCLLVDDSQDDADLLLIALKQGGFDPIYERVDTEEAMTRALAERSWDIVISDWCMPRFSAPAAFAALRAVDLDLPFIIVSGTIGEETAVAALRAGAHDFLLKDKLTRLGPAVVRELNDAATRREGRAMQEQLLLADRMASVGLLAAGAAHEINTPLACVIANVQLAMMEIESLTGNDGARERLQEQMRDAADAATRIRQIVRDLRVFSRGEDDARAAVDVHAALELALRMASHEIRPRAEVITDYGSMPRVDANESRLGQVFLNLLVNAAQAIGEAGTGDHAIRIVTRTDKEGRALIEVHDTGCGIPKEVLGHLFTPFRTTKPVGVGTGLGLSICHRIISGLGGQISAHSELGVGTTFRVVLPPSREQRDKLRASA